jgi:RNA polymerase sigma-70 factor (ECF subfamily)
LLSTVIKPQNSVVRPIGIPVLVACGFLSGNMIYPNGSQTALFLMLSLTNSAQSASRQATLTELLRIAQRGNREAWESALPLIYNELRRIAAYHMQRERAGHLLQPTALISEIWLKLRRTPDLSFESRAHFFSICSRLMRQILVDLARRTMRDHTCLLSAPAVDLGALNAAMADLEKLSARQCRVVEMRYFGGMTNEEIAVALGTSPRTVKRDWVAARAWLYNYLFGSGI